MDTNTLYTFKSENEILKQVKDEISPQSGEEIIEAVKLLAIALEVPRYVIT